MKRPNAPHRRFADPRPAVNPIVETEAFKRWFGASKVVNAWGDPQVVYHGTGDARGLFLPEVSTSGKPGFHTRFRGTAFFATDTLRVANTYADDRRAFDYQAAEPLIVPLYLRIENPMVIDMRGARWSGTEKRIAEAVAAGHDGVIIRNSVDDYGTTPASKPSTVYVFFSPHQAKSAQVGVPVSRVDRKPLPWAGPNDGSFDLDDPDLRSNGRFPGYVTGVSDEDPDCDDLIEQAWDIANASGINILSDKALTQVAVLHDEVVGAGFSSIDNGEIFSFDVVVAPKAQRTGAGSALVEALEDEYLEAREVYPELVLEAYVVGAGMMHLLEGRGYTKRWERGALLMSKELS